MTDIEITEKLAEFMGWDMLTTDGFKNPLVDISDAWELKIKLLGEGYSITIIEVPAISSVMSGVNILMSKSVFPATLDHYDIAINEYSECRAICMAVIKVIENG